MEGNAECKPPPPHCECNEENLYECDFCAEIFEDEYEPCALCVALDIECSCHIKYRKLKDN